jgi:hypothetical protein
MERIFGLNALSENLNSTCAQYDQSEHIALRSYNALNVDFIIRCLDTDRM